MTARAVSVWLVAASVLVYAPAALGSYPGANGRLVVSMESCYGERLLASLPWRGGDLRQITPNCRSGQGEDEDMPPTFEQPDAFPDGQAVLARRCTNLAGQSNTCGLVTVDAASGAVTDVDAQEDEFEWPSLSPDGERFAALRYFNDRQRPTTDLWTFRIDGSSSRPLLRSRDYCNKGENCATFTGPRWSPDGKVIAVEVRLTEYDPQVPPVIKPGIWLIRARDGKPVRRLAKRGAAVDWAPDGRHIVYTTPWRLGGEGASGGNLYIARRDGKSKRELVHRHHVAEVDPVWSPDGRWIAWVSIAPSGSFDPAEVRPSLWRVRRQGGRPRLIKKLPEPWVDQGFAIPQIAWLATGAQAVAVALQSTAERLPRHLLALDRRRDARGRSSSVKSI